MLLSRAGNSYTNDADGNTLTGGGRSMVWDAQNRMASCTKGVVTSSFTYGADGLRRQMTANGTTTDYVLDNSMFVRERNHANGASIATYLVGARGPEYRRDDVAGTVRWYLYDGLGSVLGEVDPTGAVTSSRKYDVYGAVRGGVNPGGTSRHKFVGSLGHPSDDETGLIYMRARYYDPAVGRFASEDPSFNGTNWYVYSSNSPALRVDNNGRSDDVFTFFWKVWNVIQTFSFQALIALSDAFAGAAHHYIRIAENDFALACKLEIDALAQSGLSEASSATIRSLANEMFETAVDNEAKGVACLNISNQLRILAYIALINNDASGSTGGGFNN